MTKETNTPTPAIHALLRSKDHLSADEIQQISNMVPNFATRYADHYFKDRSASRARKNLLTGGILFLCFAIGISLIVGAVLRQPVHQAITSAMVLLNAVGGAFMYFTNRK
ncbi:MAG TPA: hypothetical protein VJR02_02555 [Pyrinomonadaceae bacterium]|nr:hypothetical protein [Pyrinomonadaceae bacterium]